MTLGVAVCLHSRQTEVCPLCAGTCILPDMTLGVVVRLRSCQTGVCLLRARAYPTRPSVSPFIFTALRPKSVRCVSRLSFFLFGSAFQTMCPPSLKFITWVFELQIFKFQTLLTKVHTVIDSTFSNSLRSTVLRFDLHSNKLINMHLRLIFQRSCMDLPNLGLGPLCCAKLF